MKKVLGIAILTFLIFSNNVNAQRWGEGELQLTKSMAETFIKFIRGKGNKKPADFYITLDGTDGTYWTCSYAQCVEGDPIQDIYHCERQTGKKCKKFAWKRTVKWKNGINPGKGKVSKFSSEMTDAQIYAKLEELGFYKKTKLVLYTYDSFLLDADDSEQYLIEDVKKIFTKYKLNTKTKEGYDYDFK